MRQILLDKDYNEDEIIILDREKSNHIIKVLRLKKGSFLKALSPSLKDYTLILEDEERKGCSLRVKKSLLKGIKEFQPLPLNSKPLSLAISFLKAKKLELIVKMATEIGVNNIFLVESETCVKSNISDIKLDRLKSIIINAIEQSGARVIPNIQIIKFKDLLDLDFHLITLEPTIESKSILDLKIKDNPLLFIGPEGGFSEKEIIALKEKGDLIYLNTNILRSETACIYSLSILRERMLK